MEGRIEKGVGVDGSVVGRGHVGIDEWMDGWMDAGHRNGCRA